MNAVKTVVPDYYARFRCIAGACRHTCCAGWEIEADADSLARWRGDAEIEQHIEYGETPHIRLTEDGRCPFLNSGGLCRLILRSGEGILCQTCRDHPRFRSFWTDRVEMGLGLVCEEAARLILSREAPMRELVLEDDGADGDIPGDEAWLTDLRASLMDGISETGPRARLLEYLLWRHLPDALYDGRLEARLAFIESAFREVTAEWEKTDGSLAALAETARKWSYDVEYDADELEKRLAAADKER